MLRRRPIAAFALAAALAVAAAAVFVLRGTSVETSVYAMLGDGADAIPEDIREESSRTVFVVFSSPSAKSSCAASKIFLSKMSGPLAEHIDHDAGSRGLATVSRRADGLLSESDREALSTPEGRAKIARAAIRRYVASPLPPMFKPEDDPFCVKERFVASLGDSPDSIVALPLVRATANDADALALFKKDLDDAVEATRLESDPAVRIMPCGVPLHTLRAVSNCRREVGWLSLFSSLFVLFVALAVFRPFSRVAYPVANLAASASAGAIALFLYSPTFHLMTAVFGTSVLGLVADYSFHLLLCAPGERRRTVANLAVSFATTALALAPLAISSLPVLRESAVFLAASLAAAYVFAVLTHPEPAPAGPRQSAAGRSGLSRLVSRTVVPVVLAAVFMVAVFEIPRFRVKTDPAALYAPPPELLEPEKILASKWTPPPPDVAANLRLLYEEQGANVADALGLAAVPAPPAAPDDGAAALAAALDRLTDETFKCLLYALVAMLAVLVAAYRLRAAAVAAPSAFALLAAAGAVALSGEALNLFHLLAGFLLAGMCVDYAVFTRSGGRGAAKSVTCSLLTSMAGFGALAFVSFRPVAAFGTVLGVGLPSGCLAAFAMRGLAAVPDDDGSVEKAASPLGMEIVWLCYRVFGLGAMRLVARFAAGCVWAFSPSVRKASPSFWKLMMFARSLADKVAVASGRGSLPRVRDDGSEDARAFAADVLSGRGVFVVSSHCGTVEALLALADRPPVFHAWTDIARTSAFNAFYLKHADMGRISLHSISDIGMDTAFEAAEWLEKGECLVMAGDRGTGAFRFAAALGHPVYFAACIADGPGYVAVVRRLHGGAKEMQGMFDEILGELAGKHPEQVYEWNNR